MIVGKRVALHNNKRRNWITIVAPRVAELPLTTDPSLRNAKSQTFTIFVLYMERLKLFRMSTFLVSKHFKGILISKFKRLDIGKILNTREFLR